MSCSCQRRDPGPIEARRIFSSEARARRFRRKIAHRHPEAVVRKSGARWVVRWKTKSERDPGHKALDKKALWKSIDKDQKAAARAKIRGLQAEMRAAVAARRGGRKAVTEYCSLERQKAREKIATLRESLRAQLREVAQAERALARGSCERARTEPKAEVERLRSKLREERAFLASMRRIQAGQRKAKAARPKTAARIRESESDDEVRANIPPDLVPLFNRVRKMIKPGLRKSRTEAFLEYVEEHPGEEYQGIEDETERMIREHEQALRSGTYRDRSRRRRARVRARRARHR